MKAATLHKRLSITLQNNEVVKGIEHCMKVTWDPS